MTQQPNLFDLSPPYLYKDATLRYLHSTLGLVQTWVQFQEQFRKAPLGCEEDPLGMIADIPEITILHASPLSYLTVLIDRIRTIRHDWDKFVREWDLVTTKESMLRHHALVCMGGSVINSANKTEADLNATISTQAQKHRNRFRKMVEDARDQGTPLMIVGPNGPMNPEEVLDMLDDYEDEDDYDELDDTGDETLDLENEDGS